MADIRVFMVGDSTMDWDLGSIYYPMTGWGLPFSTLFQSDITVTCLAEAGRDSTEGLAEQWPTVMAGLRAGDYVLIQFGHNDENDVSQAQFTANLTDMVEDAQGVGAIPILITPVSRYEFSGSTALDSHPVYAPLVVNVATSTSCLLIDLNTLSRALNQFLGPTPAKALYQIYGPGVWPNYPAGITDPTHFQEYGAGVIAELVLQAMQDQAIALGGYGLNVMSVFYVSTTGSDAADGSLGTPWLTVKHATDTVAAGDTIRVAPGTYAPAVASTAVYITTDGSSGSPITLQGYGGVPVISGANITSGSTRSALTHSADWWIIEDIDFAYCAQPTAFAVGVGMLVTGASNNIFRRCRMYGNNGAGVLAGDGGVLVNNLWQNCDFFDNYDPQNAGGNGDGIQITAPSGTPTGNVVEYCRAWHNSDDGFDLWEMEFPVTLRYNWAFLQGVDAGNGSGFKLGQNDSGPRHQVIGNISFNNINNGFMTNSGSGPMDLLNNTAYLNAQYGFVVSGNKASDAQVVHVLKNNIAALNTVGQAAGSSLAGSTLANNSWTSLTVTDADFTCIDPTRAKIAREADGSLPKISLFRPVTGSDLLGAGVDVGLAFYGTAPDVGAVQRPRFLVGVV